MIKIQGKRDFTINSLRIKDALKKDSGRGIARINPHVIKKLDLKTGDMLEISNSSRTKTTVAL